MLCTAKPDAGSLEAPATAAVTADSRICVYLVVSIPAAVKQKRDYLSLGLSVVTN